jgi:hypothetical protein
LKVVARFSELNRIVLWEKRFAGAKDAESSFCGSRARNHEEIWFIPAVGPVAQTKQSHGRSPASRHGAGISSDARTEIIFNL